SPDADAVALLDPAREEPARGPARLRQQLPIGRPVPRMPDDQRFAIARPLHRAAQVGPDGLAHQGDVAGAVRIGGPAHGYQPIGFSLRLMCTCLTCRYSSTPQGPSSRPMPLIL